MELTSEHFVLHTDTDPAAARSTLADVERIHAALSAAMGRSASRGGGRVDLVVFARSSDYQTIAGDARTSEGYFAAHPASDFEPRPTVVIHAGPDDEARTTLKHEMAHRLLRERFADLPPWLDEGLAQYYSTLRIDGSEAFVGGPQDLLWANEPRAWGDEREAGRTGIPAHEVPSVQEIIDADRATFHAFWTGVGDEPTYRERRRQFFYYVGARKLVELLFEGPSEYRFRFAYLLGILEKDARGREAFRTSFTGVAMEELDRALRWSLAHPLGTERALPFRPPSPARIEARVLPDADVHVLWARLRSPTEKGRGEARRDLDEALLHEPRSADARLCHAFLSLSAGDLAAARRDLEEALVEHPYEARYLAARISLERRSGTPGPRARLHAFAARLGSVATSAAQLDAVAWYLAESERPDEGLLFAERAIQADARCWLCQDTYATLLLKAGRPSDALAASDRALVLLPEGAAAPAIVVEHRRQIAAALALQRRSRP